MNQRPIKFRAWDKSGGEVMLDVYAIDFYNRRIQFKAESEDPNNPLECWRNWDDSGDLTLMQFTGLHDKNGKEIWEGDVVENVDAINITAYSFCPVGGRWKISFKFGMFIFETADERGHRDFIRPKSFVVIGNIYENEDLLTPKG